MELFDYLLAKKKGGGGGSSDIDWSTIGYEDIPSYDIKGYNYAIDVYNNWIPAEDLSSKFQSDIKLFFLPQLDTSLTTNFKNMCDGCYCLSKVGSLNTSNGTNFQYMFNSCHSLIDVPVFNFSSVIGSSSFNYMFNSCRNLSYQSIDNIMQSCITALSFTGTKTLARLGIPLIYYSQEIIEALPHYQDFIAAGWTTGY